MSPVLLNGRELGVASNGVFTEKNTDPIPLGKLWPEAALTWNLMVADYVADGGSPGDFVPAGPNSSARSRAAQDYFWDQHLHHGGPPAAPPYTSNHGWAIAVDVKTHQAAAWLMIHGEKYGWSHDEGERVGEWWHFRLVGTYSRAIKKRMQSAHALDGYTSSEKRWIKEYDHLKRVHPHSHRLVVLRRVMTAQRKRIWLVAQPKPRGDGHVWTRSRKRRYKSLKKRTS